MLVVTDRDSYLVDEPMEIRDGWITAPDRPGHGLVLSDHPLVDPLLQLEETVALLLREL